jgi:hypothetical protein
MFITWPTLTEVNSIKAVTSYFFKLCFNIILQSTPKALKNGLFPSVPPPHYLSSLPFVLHLPHLILLDLITVMFANENES